MKLPRLIELLEKTRYSKETGKEPETPFQEYERILQPYIDKEDHFIFGQYSNIKKLGINPTSQFNTPLGIYSYPLIYINPKDIQTGHVPFAGDRKYIVLFTVKPQFKNKVAIVNNHGELEGHSPLKDNFFKKQIQKYVGKTGDFDKEFREEMKTTLNGIKNILPNLESHLDILGPKAETFKKTLSRMEKVLNGTYKFVPKFKKLNTSTPNELLTFLNNAFSFVDPDKEILKLINTYAAQVENYINDDPDYAIWVDRESGPEKKARYQTPFGIYWNVTRVKAIEQSEGKQSGNWFHDSLWNKDYKQMAKHQIIDWGQMMMKDGVYGIIDGGAGIVHPSEPTQAVFFSKEALQLITIITNPALRKRDKGKEELYEPKDAKNIKNLIQKFKKYESITSYGSALRTIYFSAAVHTGATAYSQSIKSILEEIMDDADVANKFMEELEKLHSFFKENKWEGVIPAEAATVKKFFKATGLPTNF